MSFRKTYYTYISNNLRIQHVANYNLDISGKYYQPHTHELAELTYIIEADGYHAPEDREYKLKKHDLVITPPFTYHRMNLKKGSVYERYNLTIHSDFIKDIDLTHVFQTINVINCTSLPRITDIFKKTDFYWEHLNETQFEDIAVMLVKEIFYNISILNNDVSNVPFYVNPILSKAIDYINSNLHSIKSISEISAKLYITDSYLYEIFKKHLKTSPKKYITSKRLHIAKNGIISGKKPTEVFSKVGFSDYTSFYRNFTTFFGYPPSKEQHE